MKLRILVKIIEKILGVAHSGDGPRADMYLPDKLLAFALVLLAGGTAFAAFAIYQFAVWAVVGAVLCLVLGVFALLSWKNQTIHMISEESFTYTTLFGNTRTYSFSDIRGLRENKDSMTLYVANDKVHMEAMAFISDRLAERINQALAEAYKNNTEA